MITTANSQETATALIAMYEADQKDEDEHRTFKRHIRAANFHPNPQVTMLMGCVPGLGDKLAGNLIRKYGTVWNVLSATPAQLVQVEGIGSGRAKQILQIIGRPDA